MTLGELIAVCTPDVRIRVLGAEDEKMLLAHAQRPGFAERYRELPIFDVRPFMDVYGASSLCAYAAITCHARVEDFVCLRAAAMCATHTPSTPGEEVPK